MYVYEHTAVMFDTWGVSVVSFRRHVANNLENIFCPAM